MVDACTFAQWRLSALVDDELPDDEVSEVIAHADVCDDCFAELGRIEEAKSRLRLLSLTAPRLDLFAGIEDLHRARTRRLRRFARVSIATGSTMILVTVVAALTEPVVDTVTPPVEVFVVDHVARTGGGPILQPVNLGR